jgi:alpha-amylase
LMANWATMTTASSPLRFPTLRLRSIPTQTPILTYSAVMFANLDYSQPSVRHDIFNWSSWITEELSLSGLRLDAMKHYSQSFQRELVAHLDSQFGRDFFFVGEYWTWDSYLLSSIIGKFKGRISLFDVQLVYNLSEVSMQKQRDLRRVFDGALVQLHPQRAVVRFSLFPLLYPPSLLTH